MKEKVNMSWQEMVNYIHDNMESLAGKYGLTLKKDHTRAMTKDNVNRTELVYTGTGWRPSTDSDEWNEARLVLWYSPEQHVGNHRCSDKVPYIQMKFLHRKRSVSVDDWVSGLHSNDEDTSHFINIYHKNKDHSERYTEHDYNLYIAYPYQEEERKAVEEFFYVAKYYFDIVSEDSKYSHSEDLWRAHDNAWANVLLAKKKK